MNKILTNDAFKEKGKQLDKNFSLLHQFKNV
jgi:hypothetical protein